ncbi:hypothetical protein N7L96_08150 [Mammaliicoccus sciuri]|uniref:Uncharacterized protein n=1 Tax=Mammaliicoccus sciuri TaxID=1296 RepID=A0AAJ4SJP1_MAMSC|nr:MULTISPECIES: hypothetical protein [Mammaliicoccus]EZX21754.1 hypothetical protein V070_01538 [Staphylococcus aureus C0673]MBF9298991.1 hypothetical protein [Staphylococcus schleiferi]MCD8836317.1 hypothetical protein [Mammaliicoccus sciuri]MCJ0913049.1 hypothetical protein [Mammaliicoccus sciuri]MCJ0919727.1 hypothetical protein [Mammaliicoccus sciuri]
MHEKEFVLIEGGKMTLLELGHEIETITGRTLQSTTGEVRSWPSEAVNFNRKSNINQVTYRFNDVNDLIDATIEVPRGFKNYDTDPVTIKLLTYIRKA